VDISSIALTGLESAQDRFDLAAARVTGASTQPEADTVDLSQPVVDLLAARNQFAGAVEVVHVADDMQKALLDVMG
jgi:flagellar hook protein FlgE